MAQKLIDEIGNQYGALTVLEIAKDKNNRTAWLCQCKCGNTKIVRGSDLRTGKITTCGKKGCPYKKERSGVFKDETGNIYGKLTVLYRSPQTDNGKVKWHCICECGKECDVTGADLRNGKQVSCGCYNSSVISDLQFKNEIGNRYGRLVVESLVSKGPKAVWRCRCDCGNYTNVRGTDLRSGNTKSCGCILSWKEEEIQQILTDLNVEFQRQYTFNDLYGDYNKKLRFDFGIFRQHKLLCLIEYQGIQHTVHERGTIEDFERLKQYDKRKVEYCRENNIPLLLLDKNNTNLKEDILTFIGGI